MRGCWAEAAGLRLLDCGCWASAADPSLPAASSRCQFLHFPSTKSAILFAFAWSCFPISLIRNRGDAYPISVLRSFLPESSSRWASQTAARPATNLIWRRSTPVWLAIWRTWAGFANSQLLPDAAAGALSRALGAESTAERQLFRWKHLSAG